MPRLYNMNYETKLETGHHDLSVAGSNDIMRKYARRI